jgi:hypothetical protein
MAYDPIGREIVVDAPAAANGRQWCDISAFSAHRPAQRAIPGGESMTVQYVPTGAEVVRFYDEALPLISRLPGHNVHVGYWRSADCDRTPQQAMDNLTQVMMERTHVTAGSRCWM